MRLLPPLPKYASLANTLYSTGEFFTPDKSSGNAYTSVLVYSDSTQELFEVENTQSDTAKAVKLRPRGDIEEPEASPCLDEGDLISYPSDPTITEGPESPGYPEESVYPVESEQSKEPSHPNTLEEYEYPKKPMYLDKPEETGMPEESWTCVDTATNVNESDGCENTPTIPSATKEIDIPNSLKTDLPILPPVVTSHSTSFPNSTVFVTYSPYKPSAKETSKGPVSISTTTPSSPSDAKPTSSKDAKTTSNVSTTAVPDVPGMAVTVLAPAGGLAFCILLGLSFVA